MVGDGSGTDDEETGAGGTGGTRVFFVRHGESVWNLEHRLQGHSGPGLSEHGHDQARRLGAWLAETVGRADVVSSDLPRATETAAHVAAALGTDVVVDQDLRERSWGRWEGRTVDDLVAEDSSAWNRRALGEDVAEEVGGESGRALADRVVAAVERHVRGRQAVVLVSHGGSIWHALHRLLALPAMTLGGVANTGVAEVLVAGDGSVWLESYNRQAHLAGGGNAMGDSRTSFPGP